MSKMGGTLSMPVQIVKVEERDYEGRKFYRARCLDEGGEVYDMGIADKLVSERPELKALMFTKASIAFRFTQGKFNAAVPQIVAVDL